MHLVRFRRRVRLMILDQATIEALETPNSSDARKREIKSTKKHETHPETRRVREHFLDWNVNTFNGIFHPARSACDMG